MNFEDWALEATKEQLVIRIEAGFCATRASTSGFRAYVLAQTRTIVGKRIFGELVTAVDGADLAYFNVKTMTNPEHWTRHLANRRSNFRSDWLTMEPQFFHPFGKTKLEDRLPLENLVILLHAACLKGTVISEMTKRNYDYTDEQFLREIGFKLDGMLQRGLTNIFAGIAK